MNIEKLKHEWFALFFFSELKDAPISKTLLGKKLVFLKIKDEIICFEDRCPHRNVPLSKGKIVNNQLRCNYHGWSFNETGKLEDIPGCDKCNENVKLNKFSTQIADDLVWVRLKGEKKFVNHFEPSNGYSNKTSIKHLKSDFIHTIENFLDPMHTPYIHKGLLRSKSRQRMSVKQEKVKNGFNTHYNLIDTQNGIINKLFDSGIDKNIASFKYPGFSKIDYLKNGYILFSVGIFFIPIAKGEVKMFVNVSFKKTFIPSFIKFTFLRPFLELAFYQDKKILESQYKEHTFFKKPYIIVKNDLVINHLLHLFKDQKEASIKEIYIKL